MQIRWLALPVLLAAGGAALFAGHWAAGPHLDGVEFRGTTRPDRVALTEFLTALRARDHARLRSLDDTSPEATGQDIEAATAHLIAEYAHLPGPVTVTVTRPSRASDAMTACLHFPPDHDLQFAGTTARFPGTSALYFADTHHLQDIIGREAPGDAASAACPSR